MQQTGTLQRIDVSQPLKMLAVIALALLAGLLTLNAGEAITWMANKDTLLEVVPVLSMAGIAVAFLGFVASAWYALQHLALAFRTQQTHHQQQVMVGLGLMLLSTLAFSVAAAAGTLLTCTGLS